MVDTKLTANPITSAKNNPRSCGNLVVITGPSGVGKGTSVQRLLNQVPGLSRSVSVTTRTKRAEETEGIDYFFATKEEFEEMCQKELLMEWAEFAGALYGTPKAWVEKELKAGRDVILEIEVQGAKQIRDRFPHAVLIFLSPPSFAALESRLTGRATETPEKIALRLKKAKQELKQKHLFHYEVINDNLDEAVNN
ncbi:MAG: guanylate kinase, partial [Candidatus Melainabacteria bacterium]|nr:guanylate kinase [Candidatus Melainabacteria bacterium]